MRVLFVAAEASPLVKVGGLADVVGSLPAALTRLGHDVRVIIPQYGSIDLSQLPVSSVLDRLDVPLAGRVEPLKLNLTSVKNGVPVYLIESSRYFGAREVYGSDDLNRFLFFSRGVTEVLPRLDWQPEIVHCHDWHAGLVVMWLKKRRYQAALVFTIHNLAYQGLFDEAFLAASGLAQDWGDYPAGAPRARLSFMSQGILRADLVTTVSKTYASEILTPEHGEGLDALLRYRSRHLLGIINGIDDEEYNPETDPYIPATYGPSTLERRAGNKLALQVRAGLPQDARIPVIGVVQRLDEQKGIDILEKALVPIFEETGAQMVILGRGRPHYEETLRRMASQNPSRMAVFTDFNDPLARLIYGGSDMFLMPSRFEPCGLGQMIAMRYGALPVVRHTGGLADTVPELSPGLTRGNGFVFREYSSQALLSAVKGAVDAFHGKKKAWRGAVRRVMRLDFSWRASATEYQTAYQQALRYSQE